MTLVEHALCPLDAEQSLRENAVFETGFFYADKNRHAQKATVNVTCPGGLSSADEFYLWGLLALTFADSDPPESEFHATPHFCLRRLGLVDQHGNRGGRQYRQFADTLDRLAQVSYASDAFYDPVRAEHRRVRFGFLSFSLPLDPESSRAWRIAWDPIFFDLVKPLGGNFRFDLDLYRELDPAARRLFLLVSKIFDRRETTPRFEVGHLAVDVLGFSPTLAPRHQRQKLARVIASLAEAGIVLDPAPFDAPTGKTRNHTVVLHRGPRFAKATSHVRSPADSPLWDGLVAMGFDAAAANRLLKNYPRPMVREWLDITAAAKERFGAGFFKRSPQAFLVDNLKNAKASGRTPPEWWHDLRSEERQRARSIGDVQGSPHAHVGDRSVEVLRSVVQAAFAPEESSPSSSLVPTLAEILRSRR